MKLRRRRKGYKFKVNGENHEDSPLDSEEREHVVHAVLFHVLEIKTQTTIRNL